MARVQNTRIKDARGGCERCAGAQWSGKNALAQAARHHDATQHPTWAEQTQRTEYGGAPAAKSVQRSML